MSKKKEESYKHIFEECERAGEEKNNWKEILLGENRSLAVMKKIRWKRDQEKEKLRTEASR